MCLIIYKSKHKKLKPLTAKVDIVVYKIITINNKSKFQCFQYKPNTLYRLRKALKPKKKLYVNWFEHDIYEGFHAFRDKPIIAATNFKLVKFTIPKGAKYFIGLRGDIVSTSIRSGSLKGI